MQPERFVNEIQNHAFNTDLANENYDNHYTTPYSPMIDQWRNLHGSRALRKYVQRFHVETDHYAVKFKKEEGAGVPRLKR